MENNGAIQVSVRVRPLNKKEAGNVEGWVCSDTFIQSSGGGPTTKSKKFEFDHVFHPGSQQDIYAQIASPIVKKAMQGFNGTVFAYGQTGSGKTWSTMGSNDGAEEHKGIIPRSIEEIFTIIETEQDHTTYSLQASYLEVYNERINDLLGDAQGQGKRRRAGASACAANENLRIISDDPIKGAIIDGLTEETVSTRVELLGLIARGEKNRHYGSTNMNANSSRSHTIYRLVVEAERSTGKRYMNI